MARQLKRSKRSSTGRSPRVRKGRTIEKEEAEILLRHLPEDEEDNLITDLRLRRDKRIPFEQVLRRYGYPVVED